MSWSDRLHPAQTAQSLAAREQEVKSALHAVADMIDLANANPVLDHDSGYAKAGMSVTDFSYSMGMTSGSRRVKLPSNKVKRAELRERLDHDTGTTNTIQLYFRLSLDPSLVDRLPAPSAEFLRKTVGADGDIYVDVTTTAGDEKYRSPDATALSVNSMAKSYDTRHNFYITVGEVRQLGMKNIVDELRTKLYAGNKARNGAPPLREMFKAGADAEAKAREQERNRPRSIMEQIFG